MNTSFAYRPVGSTGVKSLMILLGKSSIVNRFLEKIQEEYSSYTIYRYTDSQYHYTELEDYLTFLGNNLESIFFLTQRLDTLRVLLRIPELDFKVWRVEEDAGGFLLTVFDREEVRLALDRQIEIR